MPHPDYQRLQQVFAYLNDGNPDDPNDPHFVMLLESMADFDSLHEVAVDKVEQIGKFMLKAKDGQELRAVLMAFFTYAFSAGVMFQRAGGHIDT